MRRNGEFRSVSLENRIYTYHYQISNMVWSIPKEAPKSTVLRWIYGAPMGVTWVYSIYLSICLSIYLSIYLSIDLSIYLSVCLSLCLSVSLSVCLSVYLSICLSVYLSICLSIYLSLSLCIYLSLYVSIYLSIYLLSFSLSFSLSPSLYRTPQIGVGGTTALAHSIARYNMALLLDL